jgi:predicted Zn-dependent peptidase
LRSYKRLAVYVVGLVVMASPGGEAWCADFSWYQFPNGLSVGVLQNESSKQAVIDTWFAVGSRNETPAQNGMSHFLEHVVFKPKPGEPAIDVAIESLGGYTNAATSKDFTHYYYVLPTLYTSNLLDTHLNMVFKPAFPAEAVKREQPVVQEEIYRAINAPFRILFDTVYADLYHSTPPLAQTVLGPPDNIAQFDSNTVCAYYKSFYTPRNGVLLIATSTPADQIRQQLEGYFHETAQPLAAPPRLSVGPSPSIDWNHVIRHKWHHAVSSSLPMPVAFWAFPEPPATFTIQQKLAYQVWMYLLASGQDSILHRGLVEQSTDAAYSVGASWMRHAFEGFSYLYIMAKPTAMPTAMHRMQTLLQDNAWLTQARLNRAKKELLLALAQQETQPADKLSEMGEALVKGYAFELEEQERQLAALTLEDVRQAGLQMQADQKRATVPFLLWPDQLEQQSMQYEKAWLPYCTLQGTVSSRPRPLKILHKKASKPANANVVEQAVAQIHVGYPGFVRKDLPESHLVDIAWHLPLYSEDQATHTALEMMEALWLVKGQTSTSMGVGEYLKDLGVNATFQYTQDVLSIRFETTTQNADALLQAQRVLLENGHALEFDANTFEVARHNAIASVQMLSTNPQGLMQAQAAQDLYAGQPNGVQLDAKIKALQALKMEDVQTAWHRVWQEGSKVLTMAGPTATNDHLLEGLRLGHLLHEDTQLNAAKVNSLASGRSMVLHNTTAPIHRFIEKPDQATSWVMWAWLLPSLKHTDMPALQLLQSYLGQGMSARLFQEVREKRSLAYEVNAALELGQQKSVMQWYAGVKPEHISELKEVFRALQQEVTHAPLSDEALAQVKQKRIGRFEMSLNTPSDWVSLQGRVAAQGLPASYLDQYAQRLNAVTAKQVLDVARRYLAPTPDVSLVLGRQMPPSKTAGPPHTDSVK